VTPERDVDVIKTSWRRHRIQGYRALHSPFERPPSEFYITMSLSTRLADWPSRLAPWLAQVYLALLTLMLPVAPLCASLLFGRRKYVMDYLGFVRRMRVHISALREGPARHYFEDVMGRASTVPAGLPEPACNAATAA